MRFADIPGNDDVKRALRGMADSGRVAHAMLFYENEGCGGLPMALAYFQYLNCQDRRDGDSCGECPSCRKISRLIHPDLHFVFPVNSGSKVSASDKPVSESYLTYWRELVLANPYFLESELYAALGIEGAVAKSLLYGPPLLDEAAGSRAEVCLVESFPDVVYGLLRGVEHIGGVEAVVAQLVEHYLVGREVCAARVGLHQAVGRHEQRGL